MSGEIQRDRTAGHKESSPFCRFQVYYVTVPLPMEGRLRMAARRAALQQSRLPGGDPRVLWLRAKLIPQHCNRQQPVTMMHRCITKDTTLLVRLSGRRTILTRVATQDNRERASVCAFCFLFIETEESGTFLHLYIFFISSIIEVILLNHFNISLAEGVP